MRGYHSFISGFNSPSLISEAQKPARLSIFVPLQPEISMWTTGNTSALSISLKFLEIGDKKSVSHFKNPTRPRSRG